MGEALRSLHLPVSYLPWTVGGKEVYCHGLCRALRALGHEVLVAIHHDGNTDSPVGDFRHEEVPVRVLPPIPGPISRSAIYGCEPSAIPGFDDLLDSYHPHVVHFHDFSAGANLLHMRSAKRGGARIVLTYHSPGQFCPQRSLLYRGESVCDGWIDAVRCTECRLGVQGIPAVAGRLMARIPQDGLDSDSDLRLVRALTARAATDRFIGAWRECVETVDRIQIHADWVHKLLDLNSVPAGKVTMIRSGVPTATVRDKFRRRHGHRILRLAFVGRCDPVKGVHVLVEAVRSLEREAPIRVSFFGPYWDTAYGRQLARIIKEDSRFEVPRQVAPSEVVEALMDFDACVVPSVWLETGPLVVLEAFAAGIPVIGSRLGGIAELVRDGVDGRLHTPGDPADLARVLRELIKSHPDGASELAANVTPPRTMFGVAADMEALYKTVLKSNARSNYATGGSDSRSARLEKPD